MRIFFKVLFGTAILFTFSFLQLSAQIQTYEIDITNHADDLFHVIYYPGSLSNENEILRFPKFVPGTYSEKSFGRFVEWIKAYDVNGKEIAMERVDTNLWRISDPESVFKFEYDCEDALDAQVTDHKVYPMSATGIEDNYVVINTFGVCAYFKELKDKPCRVGVYYDRTWTAGTALDKHDDGYYYADSYYHLADSPILIGELEYASKMVGDIEVEIYNYAESEALAAPVIMDQVSDVLTAAKEFLSYSPVKRYSFLMYFMNQEDIQRNNFQGLGALEHSYSSLHALFDSPNMLNGLPGILGHEFMHILTPLNLHSQYIANYDYSNPSTDDMHIWLYEGTTEWVSDIMLLRNGYFDLEKYLGQISAKLSTADNLRKDLSLVDLSTGWDQPDIGSNFVNFYNKGAVTATLLDIRLLELSNGKRGLRELYFDLINKYGKDNPFENDKLFDEIVDMTYPEIRDFIEKYIKGTEPLPVKDYFAKLGIDYTPVRKAEKPEPIFGLGFTSPDGKGISISNISSEHKPFGLQVGDIVLKVFGEEVNLGNAFGVINKVKSMNVGDKYDITVLRGDEEIDLTGELVEKKDKHVFELNENPSPEQLALRQSWMTNLHAK